MTTIDTSPEALERLILYWNAVETAYRVTGNSRTKVYEAAEKTCGVMLAIAAEKRAGAGDTASAFLAGAKAMQEAAAMECDDLHRLYYVSADVDAGGAAYEAATAIRAIDPAALTGRPVAPVVDGAMVQRAMDTFGMPPSFKAMRRALEAALTKEQVK